MNVLGIESTCDETACSIVRDGKQILSNIIFSQTEFHKEFGGVVPELACRKHIDYMLPVIQEALNQANLSLPQIDLFAVAQGPGLVGALLIGLNAVKTLSLSLKKPFVGVNHIEAHLYAAMMDSHQSIRFPALGVILSGGHSSLWLLHGIQKYIPLSETVDDAVGEAFDKVAKILGLPYPGGPQIEQHALKGDPLRFPFKPGNVKGKPLHFSFSGLKTAVMMAMQGKELSASDKFDIAASFQEVALTDIVRKTVLAAKQHSCHSLIFGGGVTNNAKLRQMFQVSAKDWEQYWPGRQLSLDNAAMIAGLGYHVYQLRGPSDLSIEPYTQIYTT